MSINHQVLATGAVRCLQLHHTGLTLSETETSTVWGGRAEVHKHNNWHALASGLGAHCAQAHGGWASGERVQSTVFNCTLCVSYSLETWVEWCDGERDQRLVQTHHWHALAGGLGVCGALVDDGGLREGRVQSSVLVLNCTAHTSSWAIIGIKI